MVRGRFRHVTTKSKKAPLTWDLHLDISAFSPYLGLPVGFPQPAVLRKSVEKFSQNQIKYLKLSILIFRFFYSPMSCLSYHCTELEIRTYELHIVTSHRCGYTRFQFKACLGQQFDLSINRNTIGYRIMNMEFI
jgi:hypothetical protein